MVRVMVQVSTLARIASAARREWRDAGRAAFATAAHGTLGALRIAAAAMKRIEP
jgi:hypothetical protein